MGYTCASDVSEAETIERQGYSQDDYEDQEGDPAMRQVAVTEAYMKIDVDGTGVPVLHRFICGGTNYKLLDFEPWDEIPFAVFEVDPEPHTFYGRSLAEIIMDDQDASTAILRGVLDNVAMTNNPRIGIVDGAVNIDDVLNNEIGAIVRHEASWVCAKELGGAVYCRSNARGANIYGSGCREQNRRFSRINEARPR